MPAQPATRIVFDLDGTLVQTRVASWEVFQGVQEEFGLGIDTAEDFFSHFEGNFFASIRAFCEDERLADAVIDRFFEKLESDYRPTLVPGIADVVHALAPRATLAVLSSNATSVIRRVLDENGLQFCFAHVFGGDVEPDKSAGLRRFLADAAQGVGRRCSPSFDEGSADAEAAASDTVLVTDTVGDAEAALAAGVRVVGVSWGMHSADRLRAAGAEFVAVWPQELIAYLAPAGTAIACEVIVPAAPDSAAVAPTGGVGAAVSPQIATPADIRRARRLGAAGLAALRPGAAAAPNCGCAPMALPHAVPPAERGSGATIELAAAMRAITSAR